MPNLNIFGQIISKSQSQLQPCEIPPHQRIFGQYCQLAPLSVDTHAKAIFATLKQDAEKIFHDYPPGEISQESAFIDWLQSLITSQKTLLYAILANHTKQVVGMIGCTHIKPEHGVIEIAHLHFSKQMTPLLDTEAIYLLLTFLFDELKYRRVQIKCDTRNVTIQNAAKRFNFQLEGIFRNHFIYNGENRDTLWFAMLDHEWLLCKNKFTHWFNTVENTHQH